MIECAKQFAYVCFYDLQVIYPLEGKKNTCHGHTVPITVQGVLGAVPGTCNPSIVLNLCPLCPLLPLYPTKFKITKIIKKKQKLLSKNCVLSQCASARLYSSTMAMYLYTLKSNYTSVVEKKRHPELRRKHLYYSLLMEYRYDNSFQPRFYLCLYRWVTLRYNYLKYK